MAYMRLGELLMASGAIDAGQLEAALQMQQKTPRRLGELLLEAGFITEGQLLEALQLQLGVEFIDLTAVPLPVELASYVPKNIAKRHTAVPVRLDRNDLYVALSDPLNFIALEELRQASGKRIVPMLAAPKAAERAVATLYGNEDAARVIEEMKQEAGISSRETVDAAMASEANGAPTVRFVNGLIERAFRERASDIHLEPQGEALVVRMRIDGRLRKLLTVPADLQSTVTCRLKIMGGMNISQRRVPQDGHASVVVCQHRLDLRISSFPTVYGEKIMVRVLDKSAEGICKESLGLGERNGALYDRLLENSSGMILITGPTGSGKTTTMYTMLRELAREEVNITTLEDPVEYHIPGVNQCQIHEKAGMTFPVGLRALLRQDPDILSVGEIRDGETAAIAVRAAITGHLVISTLHTNNAILAVDRLRDIGVEPYLISGALRGVIAQRLVRKICPYCRESYVPHEAEKALLGIDGAEPVTFFRGQGCPACGHTGYLGRTAVFEVFVVSGSIHRLIQAGASCDVLLQAAREEGFVSMDRNCAELVRNGVTTAAEAARAIHSAAR